METAHFTPDSVDSRMEATADSHQQDGDQSKNPLPGPLHEVLKVFPVGNRSETRLKAHPPITCVHRSLSTPCAPLLIMVRSQ